MYRVRKTWNDKKSQIGAFENLDYAKEMVDAHEGYAVFDENGAICYPINYRQLAAKAAVKTYNAVISNKCKHESGAKFYPDIALKKVITCSAAMSIVLQLAGCLPEGVVISHTNATGLNGEALSKEKSTLGACMNSKIEFLEHCDLIRVDKLYKELPREFKAAGVCYVYDSNAAVSAGGGKIYSCNNSSRQLNGKKQYKMNLMSDGYCFTHRILYCIVPKERG